MNLKRVTAGWLLLLVGTSAPAFADEGMWTFDNFPRATVAERYGTNLDQAWLDRVRLATVRLSNCTASFVSAQGLLLTNHHCVESCLAENSTRDKSLIETGFTAAARTDELRCPVQIAEVLQATENVTAKVVAALKGLDDRAANERRRQTLVSLEQSCEDTSKRSGNPLKCQSVTLYDGGQYWLYKYRRYDDVRLAFAPEAAIAAFGGDPDNFQFPRWCFDMSLLRVYVNGRPAVTPNHLTIDFAGPKAGDPVFVAGHPGSTDRQLTVAELKALRDRRLPQALLRAAELRGRYIQFAKTGAAEQRIVSDALNGLENTLKVQRRQLDALLDDDLLATKRAEETDLRQRIAASPALQAIVSGDPWARIEAAEAAEQRRWLPFVFIENGSGFNSRLYRYARLLVRAAAERPKPNTARLREYADAALPRFEQQIAAPLPIYPELERLTFSFGLERMREWLGPDDAVVRQLLTDDTPDSLAARLVDGSKLADPAVRLALWKGGQSAIDASNDPMIALAKSLDAKGRELRKWHEDEIEAVVETAHEQIARAQICGVRHERVSRRHVHAAPVLRRRARLGRERCGRGALHAALAPVRARDRAAAVRGARELASRETNAEPVHAVQPFDDQRHRRRQLRQPADRRRWARRGSDLRRQYPLDLRLVLVRRRAQPRGGREHGHPSRGPHEGIPA